MSTLSQRLDSLEAEKLGLTRELQTLKTDSEHLLEALQELRQQHGLTGMQPWPDSTDNPPTAAACPACSTTGPCENDLEELHTLQNELEDLKVQVANHSARLADMDTTSQSLLRTFSSCTSEIRTKVNETDSRYREIESIVMSVSSAQKVINSNVLVLNTQAQQLQQIVTKVERDSLSRQQSLRAMVDDLERTMYTLASQGSSSTGNQTAASATSPAVAFQVIGDAVDWPVPLNGRLALPTVVVNEGSGYDRATGHFQAPVAGWYWFIVQCGIRGDATDSQLSLMKNGATAATANSQSSIMPAHTEAFMNLQAMVRLDVNDSVWLAVTDQHHHEQRLMALYASTFIGLLIH